MVTVEGVAMAFVVVVEVVVVVGSGGETCSRYVGCSVSVVSVCRV